MPMYTSWFIPNEVILSIVQGEGRYEEVKSGQFLIKEMLEGSPREVVHIIVDVKGLTKPISLIDSVRVSREVGVTANLGWIIIVGTRNKAMKFVINTATSMFQRRLYNVNTMEEAIDYLKEIDAGLNWENAQSDRPAILPQADDILENAE